METAHVHKEINLPMQNLPEGTGNVLRLRKNAGRMFVVFLASPTQNMGVSKNSGTPKWMVYFMENPFKMDDLGGKTTPIFGLTPILTLKGSICGT